MHELNYNYCKKPSFKATKSTSHFPPTFKCTYLTNLPDTCIFEHMMFVAKHMMFIVKYVVPKYIFRDMVPNLVKDHTGSKLDFYSLLKLDPTRAHLPQ